MAPGASPYPVQPGAYPQGPAPAYPPYQPGYPCEYMLVSLMLISGQILCYLQKLYPQEGFSILQNLAKPKLISVLDINSPDTTVR